MKTKYGILLLSLCATMTFSSCDDYLEPKAKDRLSEMVPWQSYSNAKIYVNSFYGYVRDYGVFGSYFVNGAYVEALTDIAKAGSSVPGAGNANIYAMQPTAITPGQNGLSVWVGAYDRIRRINEFLEGLDKYAKFSDAEKNLLKGQAHFVRGYLYFLIMRGSGSAVLRTDLNPEKNAPRSSAKDCWDFISQEFDLAVANSPEQWPDGDFGRFTKGAAYAMKSRAMLYAERWEDAYNAANEVKKLAEGKQLYALNADYSKALISYKLGNKESICEFNYTRPLAHSYDITMAPGGDNKLSGAQVMPTQELVESYELKDGGYPDWTAFHSGNSVAQSPVYDQLEPRFKATILYNGASWKGRVVEPFVEGKDGFATYPCDGGSNLGKTVTGYYVKKYLNEANTDLVNVPSEQTYVEIRYAEVLLNLAEAAFHANKPTEALAALKQVRDRVGLPTANLSGDALLKSIYQERKVELAFEGHRYWDLRRWKQAHIVLSNMRVHGLMITKSGDDFAYQYVTCDDVDRQFPQRLYTLPVPPEEIANNILCEQIDGWK